MDEQEERLRQLIAAACQNPAGSTEWQKPMHRLLIVVQELPEFKKYSGFDCPGYFLDALNQTWEWFGRNIREFEPRTSSTRTDLVKWLNGYLYWRLRDLKSPSSPGGVVVFSLDSRRDSDDVSLPTLLDQLPQDGQLPGTPSNLRTLSGLEIYIEQQQRQLEQSVVFKLELYIEQDPKKQLRNCYPRKHPECNCQMLSQRLLFNSNNPSDKLAVIAREYQINYQTLRTHWKSKGIPLLQSIVTRLGYQPN